MLQPNLLHLRRTTRRQRFHLQIAGAAATTASAPTLGKCCAREDESQDKCNA